MYRYDQFDTALVQERVDDFRDQVSRRLSGELSEEEFRPLRLMNGLYLQLHAYMLRVAVPYGTLSSRQLRQLAHIARKYDKGYGHFTTRQNIQYNWIKLADAPDILADLAAVEMHAIQTSGNCIRNVTSDQFAGVAADEVEDPRPYGEVLRQWSTFHPEFSYLPRKFKIAITASGNDRAAIKLHDIGIVIERNDAGETVFAIYAGGGMGRTPMIAQLIRGGVPRQHLLSYLEAIMRVYNRYGRRDNIYKARIKILLHEIGLEKFRAEVEAEWAKIKDGPADLALAEYERIKGFFAPPPYECLTEPVAAFEQARASDGDFARWVRRNVTAHKAAGYRAVTISLKPHDGIPGDASDAQMDAVADLADQYSFGEIRVTHEQNLVLADVRAADLHALWQALGRHGLATANAGLATDIIACPGLDYCSLANARSIPIAQKIAHRFDDLEQLEDIGELKIKISGCINACGHHHAGHIGILGVDRKGTENYQLLLGGSGAEDASLAKILGPGFDEDGVIDAVGKVIAAYRRLRQPGENFLAAYRRLGPDPFKEAVYDAA
ncbi:MAG: nitrite/sulfite reductase [Sphingomonadales bacterium]